MHPITAAILKLNFIMSFVIFYWALGVVWWFALLLAGVVVLAVCAVGKFDRWIQKPF